MHKKPTGSKSRGCFTSWWKPTVYDAVKHVVNMTMLAYLPLSHTADSHTLVEAITAVCNLESNQDLQGISLSLFQ